MKIQKWETIENGCLFYIENGIMELYAVNDSVIRCRQHAEDTFSECNVLHANSISKQNVQLGVEEQGHRIVVKTNCLSVEINRETGALLWSDCQSEKILLKELFPTLSSKDVVQLVVNQDEEVVVEKSVTADGEKSHAAEAEPCVVRSAYTTKLQYELDADEKIYGLGQGEDGLYNYRGKEQYLYQNNMKIPMPFFLSSKKYGIFINTGSCMHFNDIGDSTYWELDTIDELEYYFIKGDDYDKIIAEYRSLLGRATMLPKWAFGYLQSKERYVDQEEIVNIIKQYRELQVPIDGVILDWLTWMKGCWGDKNLDPERFDKMEEACEAIHKANAHIMISIWPNMNPDGANHKEFAAARLLLNDYSNYNAFDENARKLYWKQANKGLYSRGTDAWWCDCTEPFSGSDWRGDEKKSPKERYDLVASTHKTSMPLTWHHHK